MKPGLLMLPSAVSDSRVHNILPNKIDTDFQFSRASSATRVNHQGLIEDVGYFGPELVQNGNFSELGSELVTNGDFSNGTNDWNFTDANGQVGIYFGRNEVCEIDFTNTSTIYASQNNILTNTKSYKITLDYYIPSTNTSANYIQIRLGNTSSLSALSPNLNVLDNWTSATLYGVSNGTDLYIYTPSGAIGDKFYIDNVSVKQVDPNDRWLSLGTGWSFGDGVVSCDGSQSANTDCTQNMTTDAGKTYKITYTISEYSAGGVFIRLASGNVTATQTSAGTFSENLNAIGGTQIRIRANSTFVGTISNISVVEVQGDKPRLDYDPTNPTCPHLLLEPQSTNVIQYSEDFTQNYWAKNKVTVTPNAIISPTGELNASLIQETVYTASSCSIDLQNGISLSAGTYTLSFYVKNNKGRYLGISFGSSSERVRTNFDFNTNTFKALSLSGTTTGSASFTTLGDFYRLSITATFPSTVAVKNTIMPLATDTYPFFALQDSDNRSFYMWGVQWDAYGYATSYIPTAGATATRVGETCTNAGNLNTFNSEEGVLYAEMAALADDLTFRSISINDGTDNEAVIIRFRTNTNRINGLIRDGGSAVNNLNFDVTDIKDFHKVAYKFKTGDCALFIDGVEVATGTTAFTLSSLTNVDFDKGGNIGDFFYGKVKSLATYNRALTDTELYTITSTQYSAYSGMVAALGNYTIPC